MKFYLDTANIEEIHDLEQTGCFLGVTTNPSILSRCDSSRESQLEALIKVTQGCIFVQLVGKSKDERINDYKIIRSFFKKQHRDWVVKVPIDTEGLKTISKIKEDYPEQLILGTAIYSLEQSILGVVVGCDFLAPYVNRMIIEKSDPYKMISDLRLYIDACNSNCKILSASFKSKEQVMKSLLSGSHTCTISPGIMKELLSNSIVEKAVEKFNKDALVNI